MKYTVSIGSNQGDRLKHLQLALSEIKKIGSNYIRFSRRALLKSENENSIHFDKKNEILEKHCYTELVYGRINKKLGTDFTKSEIENLIQRVINETDVKQFEKIGKNFYISNAIINIKITVNSNTFRIITVDKLDKKQSLNE